MMEIALSVVLTNFMKIIHVQLGKNRKYLSDKGRVIAVFEILRKDLFGESIFINDDEADAIGSPSDHMLVLIFLGKVNSTLNSS
jgi:hypothetical protein